jgi:hypothetical protein
MKENPLLVLIVLAIVAAVIVVLAGHSVDGAGLLSALFVVIGLSGGAHAMQADPVTQSKNDQAAPVAAQTSLPL